VLLILILWGHWGGTTSLALDSMGKIHVVYNNFAQSINLMYGNNTSGVWAKEKLDTLCNVSNTKSIAVDSKDKVHIVCTNATVPYTILKYITNSTGPWQISEINNPTEPSCLSLARARLAHSLVNELGMPITKIAPLLGVSISAVANALKKGDGAYR
jgi:hypothetical protein